LLISAALINCCVWLQLAGVVLLLLYAKMLDWDCGLQLTIYDSSEKTPELTFVYIAVWIYMLM